RVRGAAREGAAVVAVVEDERRSTEVDVDRLARCSPAFACVPTYTAGPAASAATTPATSAMRESRALPRCLRAARRILLALTDGTAPAAIWGGSSATDAKDSSVASPSIPTGPCRPRPKLAA